MRVVAARFSAVESATAALDLLQRELDTTDAAVAPLAHPGELLSGEALLAGHFQDDVARVAIDIVERAGGEIVANVDERWTGPVAVETTAPDSGLGSTGVSH